MDTLYLVGVGIVAGVVGALCGVGGGIVVVPALLFLRGLDVKTAVGTSLACIVPTAIVGVLRTPSGRVEWGLAAVLAAGGVVGAPVGAWLAETLPAAWVKRVFALLLVAVAARLLYDSAGAGGVDAARAEATPARGDSA
jgi:uncharacterized membrane protein YfcA